MGLKTIIIVFRDKKLLGLGVLFPGAVFLRLVTEPFLLFLAPA